MPSPQWNKKGVFKGPFVCDCVADAILKICHFLMPLSKLEANRRSRRAHWAKTGQIFASKGCSITANQIDWKWAQLNGFLLPLGLQAVGWWAQALFWSACHCSRPCSLSQIVPPQSSSMGLTSTPWGTRTSAPPHPRKLDLQEGFPLRNRKHVMRFLHKLTLSKCSRSQHFDWGLHCTVNTNTVSVDVFWPPSNAVSIAMGDNDQILFAWTAVSCRQSHDQRKKFRHRKNGLAYNKLKLA